MIESFWKLAYFFSICGINLTLALLVYFRNPRHLVNRLFAVSVVWVALWTISNYFLHELAESRRGLLWGQATFAMASLIPASFLAFARAFPSDQKMPRDLVVSAFAVAGVFFFFLSFTPFIVTDVRYDDRDLRLTYGPLYPGFALYFLLGFATSFYLLWRKYRGVRGVERLRIRYLFLGTLLAVAGGATTNLVIPLLFRTSRFRLFGPAFMVFAFAFVAHAIFRHRLMDIRVVIKQSVVYIAAFVAAGAILAGLIVGTNVLLPGDQLGIVQDVVLGLVVALLFSPLKSRIQRTFDRYLYREPYDYQRTFREASRKMVTMLDLQSLLPYVCEVIARTVRPEMVGIYIRDPDGIEYRLATQSLAETEGPGDPEPLPATSGLPALLRRDRTPLLRDDLGRGNPDPALAAALEDLRRLGGEVAFPIAEEDRLTGFLVVGPKRSADPYFAEDLDLLSTLAGQAAIAIKNAQLYHEVVLVNEYVENILKTMESGVVAVSVEGKVTLFNPAAERLTGLAAAQIRSGPADRLPSALAAAIQATLADGQSRLQVETAISGVTGSATPVVCSTSPFRDPQGDLLGAVLVFSDLTQLRELEKEKQRAERLASFGALASGIAHEIKNPLVAIKTFAQLLPRKFAEDNFREEFAKVAVREIDRIGGLLERLRDLSMPSEAPLHALDLREPIEVTLALLRGKLEEMRTVVHQHYPEEPIPVAGNPAKLEELFLNLFLNALEAMGPGGELTIRLDNQEELGGAVTLQVQVSDTGPGIPEALLGKIFDPFVTTKPRGSGLGLAICRAIADSHHATIRAENSRGWRGTTVTMEFPVAVAAPEALKA